MVLQEGPIGTLQVVTLAVAIIPIVLVKVAALVEGHIHHKAGDHLVVLPLPGPEEPREGMELVRLVIHKVVNMEGRVQVEVRTQWEVIGISSMVGSNEFCEQNGMIFIDKMVQYLSTEE